MAAKSTTWHGHLWSLSSSSSSSSSSSRPRAPRARHGPACLGIGLLAAAVAVLALASGATSQTDRQIDDGLADGVKVNGSDGERQGGRRDGHLARLVVVTKGELCLAAVDPSSRGEEEPPWMTS
jgi:hypothetical protein